MKRSSIAWTDYSGGAANVVLRGKEDCPCSIECDYCYMERLDRQFSLLPKVTTCYPDKLAKLATMRFPQDGNKRGPQSKPMVFIADGGDLFHPGVPDAFIGDVVDMMMRRQDVTWQILTKRAERMRDFFQSWLQYFAGHALLWQKAYGDLQFPPSNIWAGVTAGNQAMADERIPWLLQTPVRVHFVSCEPLLGPMDISRYLLCQMYAGEWKEPRLGTIGGKPYQVARLRPRIDWVIVGGESGGPRNRYMQDEWARDLRDQCQAAYVPYFFKQHSGPKPGMGPTLDGQIYHQWPA